MKTISLDSKQPHSRILLHGMRSIRTTLCTHRRCHRTWLFALRKPGGGADPRHGEARTSLLYLLEGYICNIEDDDPLKFFRDLCERANFYNAGRSTRHGLDNQ